MGLIKKRSVKKKDGSLSDNHYKVVILMPPKRKIRQKKGRSCLALSFFQLSKCVKLFYNTILIQKARIVKLISYYFFETRGSPKIFSSLYSTHLYTNRKKKRLYLYLKYRCNLGRQKFFRKPDDSTLTRRKSTHIGKLCPNLRSNPVRPPPRRCTRTNSFSSSVGIQIGNDFFCRSCERRSDSLVFVRTLERLQDSCQWFK